MFKRIVIELSHPICDCHEKSLLWALGRDDLGKSTITVECKICHTELRVPHDKFVANFSLDTPYPKDDEPDGDFVELKQPAEDTE